MRGSIAIIIKDRTTGCYWSAQKSWVSDAGDALHFSKAGEAVDCLRNNHLDSHGAIVVWKGREPGTDLVMWPRVESEPDGMQPKWARRHHSGR